MSTEHVLADQDPTAPPVPEVVVSGRSEPAAPIDVVVPSAPRRRDSVYRRSLLASDMAAMGISLLLAASVAGHDRVRPLAFLGLPALALVAKLTGMYDRDEHLLRRSTLDEVPRLFQLATLTTLVTWLGESELIDGTLDHAQVAAFWAALLVLLVGGRWIARFVAAHVTPPERCLVVGDPEVLVRLRSRLHARDGVEFVAAIPLEHVVGDLVALRHEARRLDVHRLIISPTTVAAREDTMNLIRGAKTTGLKVSILPGVLEVVGSAVAFDDLQGLTLFGVKRFGLTRSTRMVKRAFDILGATAALLAFAPVMLYAAIRIKLGSRGPLLYRQARVGRDGVSFSIIKFRTMVDGAHLRRDELASRNEAGDGLFKIADDPRVTTAGRWLRRTSLDELPQLINVLRGEMSLVGPRPLVIDEDERITGFDRRRLVLTPGMTGPWQAAPSRVGLTEMVKMDYLYAANWSLWADVKIVLRTARHVVERRGQ